MTASKIPERLDQKIRSNKVDSVTNKKLGDEPVNRPSVLVPNPMEGGGCRRGPGRGRKETEVD